jgi:NNP family nitrate/nitrite transporter-like MFS transporter
MTTATSVGAPNSGPRISRWDPEDQAFWDAKGKRHAQRNLWISIPNLLLAFSVWVFWSVIIVSMDKFGFTWSKTELLVLPATAGLWGAIARIPYTFLGSILGGKNVCVLTTLIMIVPCLLVGNALQDPTTPLSTFQLYAALSGFGGGAFASSMSNISFFFPKREKGTALGLNAGLGNLGVSAAQFLIPAVMMMPLFGGKAVTLATGQVMHLQNAAYIWIPLLALAAIAAMIGMDNLQVAKASLSEMAVIFRRKHNWIMTVLYLMTFGSFIGYSFSFPQLIKITFSPELSGQFAFLGALVGSLARPVGGWLSDKFGGAKVTLLITLVMMLAPFGIMYYTNPAHTQFVGFLAMFLILFIATGIGNASTFRMIAIIFPPKEAAPVLGWTSAIAAFGAWGVPELFKWSISVHHSANPALLSFVAFYTVCLGLCWWYYARKNAEVPC